MSDWLDTLDPVRVAAVVEQHGNALTEKYQTNNVRFALWLHEVDRFMSFSFGVAHRDIGDWTWFDAFEDGVAPADAAREALEQSEGFNPFE